MVPVQAIARPLLIPFKMAEGDGAKVRKSALLFLMQQLAPVSIQTACALEKLNR